MKTLRNLTITLWYSAFVKGDESDKAVFETIELGFVLWPIFRTFEKILTPPGTPG